ncbi:MAG TPA: hypothetical protein VD863_16255, partial [Bradyrhizobium sp.]|nr:hypothetical protein [Bradyrhizobium sp.]
VITVGLIRLWLRRLMLVVGINRRAPQNRMRRGFDLLRRRIRLGHSPLNPLRRIGWNLIIRGWLGLKVIDGIIHRNHRRSSFDIAEGIGLTNQPS